jgi:iron complex outermembrane receptor protein
MGREHSIEIDDYSAQRVEVLKGPASLMYGSDGLAGVINIQSLLPHLKEQLPPMYLANTKPIAGCGYYDVAGTRTFIFNAYGSYKEHRIIKINTTVMFLIKIQQ